MYFYYKIDIITQTKRECYKHSNKIIKDDSIKIPAVRLYIKANAID